MIFAAGLGTRLRPLTNDRPKALVEVAGKTLLEHTILKLKQEGFEHLVVNVHHFGEMIIDFLNGHQNFGIDIKVSDERQMLLNTGGGIKHAIPLFTEPDPVLIHNVDIVSDINLNELYKEHLNNSANNPNITGATLAINQRKTSRYLMFDDGHKLCGWTNISTGEKKGKEGHHSAFAGIHVVDQQLFPFLEAIKEDSFPIIDFYLDVCNKVSLFGKDVTENKWVDCGKPESLIKANEIIELARK